MPSRVYRLAFTADPEGLWVELAGHRHGPFPDDAAAEACALRLVQRWRDRARALGGSLVRPSKGEVIVTLPEGVEVRGGEDLYEVAMRRWRT